MVIPESLVANVCIRPMRLQPAVKLLERTEPLAADKCAGGAGSRSSCEKRPVMSSPFEVDAAGMRLVHAVGEILSCQFVLAAVSSVGGLDDTAGGLSLSDDHHDCLP